MFMNDVTLEGGRGFRLLWRRGEEVKPCVMQRHTSGKITVAASAQKMAIALAWLTAKSRYLDVYSAHSLSTPHCRTLQLMHDRIKLVVSAIEDVVAYSHIFHFCIQALNIVFVMEGVLSLWRHFGRGCETKCDKGRCNVQPKNVWCYLWTAPLAKKWKPTKIASTFT